jgi:hypothetical protein
MTRLRFGSTESRALQTYRSPDCTVEHWLTNVFCLGTGVTTITTPGGGGVGGSGGTRGTLPGGSGLGGSNGAGVITTIGPGELFVLFNIQNPRTVAYTTQRIPG